MDEHERHEVGPTSEAPSGDSEAVSGVSRRRRSGALRTLGRWIRRSAVGLVVLALLGLAFLSQTARGQRLVVDALLDRVRGELAGELSVEEVRSGTLLTGLTLMGVRLDAEGGRRFAEADSLVIRYWPISLVLGIPRVRSTTLHGLQLEVSRYPKDDFTNLSRLMVASPVTDTLPQAAPTTIQFGRLSVRDGAIEILTPADEAGPLTVPAPDGGHLRRIGFEEVDLDLEDVVLRPGGAAALDARLASLSTSAFILAEPLVIREAFGEVAFGARGLEVEDAALRLQGSLLRGAVHFGPARPGDAWTFRADLAASGWGELADVAWIDPRLPAGRFRGAVSIVVTDAIDAELDGLEVDLGASAVVASGAVRFGDALSMRGLRVTASPLDVSRFDPWLEQPVPFEGFVSGQATLSGTAEDLSATGRLTLIPTGMGGGSSTVDFSGTVHTGANPGATDLDVRVDPLDFRILEAVWPGARQLARGRASIELNGRADGGMLVVADLTHESDSATASRATGRGLVRRTGAGAWVMDLRGSLSPLSLPLLDRLWPELDLEGEVAGPFRVSGTLRDLTVEGDLTAGEGRLVLEGGIDATSPASFYRLSAQVEGLELAGFTRRVPEPFLVNGSLDLEGSGFRPDSLRGSATVALRASRVGGLRIDSITASLRAADGLLTADTLDAVASGVHVAGGGSVGFVEGVVGSSSFGFRSESLLGLRPFFLGDSILTRDGLNPLEEDLLRVRGIEPDTLPSELDVRMTGSIEGSADFVGNVRDLGVDLSFDLVDGAYGHSSVDSAHVELAADGLPTLVGEWDVNVGAAGLVWEDREFDRVGFDGVMDQRRGSGALDVVRNASERYALTGSFAVDSAGGEVQLESASLDLSEQQWMLSEPTTIAWSPSALTVDSLEVTRQGDDPMWLRASGTLARGGDSSFRLDMEGFHVEQLMRVLQREDIALAGHADLSLTVLGPAEQPTINALFQVESPRFRDYELTRLTGSIEYEGQVAQLRLDAWDGSRNVLAAAGTVPVDLALTDVAERRIAEPMDLRVRTDSLEAAFALASLGALEDVAGTISGDIRIGGMTSAPQPSGSMYLRNAAWTLEALGVRHTGVAGEVLLRTDRTVGVKLSTTRTGTSTVAGVIRLDTLSNPTLDLDVTFERFLAVARRDVESTISGQFSLLGSYRRPLAQGTLTVDEGTLFVEEFARSSGIVDLRDPMLYADGLAVDTTVFIAQPLLADLRNPFLDNLRVDIDLSVPRNMWLRSTDMNVEMGGELLVRYDRGQSDLVLIGELQALRGSYVVLGRTFEVDGGTVSFIGQPGINPDLNIQASSRIRRREGERLEVNATVQGTLVQPLVTLSTEEAGLAQADVISYLIFGQASGEVGGTASSGIGQNVGAGVGTLVTGAFANQVAGALGQELGLDYLSISQGQTTFDRQALNSFFSTAQLEVGRYLGEDVFVVLVLSSPSDREASDGRRSNPVRGIRVEVAMTEAVFLETFFEDRFLRSGISGLGATGLEGQRVLGALVFTEWGYGADTDREQGQQQPQ